MGLRKKWKPPAIAEYSLGRLFNLWPQDVRKITVNSSPKFVTAYDKWRSTFAGRFTKYRAPITTVEMFNATVCRLCGAPGSTICPWCDVYNREPFVSKSTLPWKNKEEMIDWWIDYWSQHEERIIPMSDVTRPQQDPREGKTAILPLVIDDLNARATAGAMKYGTVLKSDNGRDALVDAYQEAQDLVMYLRQAIQERDERPHDAVSVRIDPVYHPTTKLEQMELPLENIRPGRFIPVSGDPANIVPTIDIVESNWGKGPREEETILQEAQRLVHGDRGEAYGHPIFDMTRTADQLTALLRDKLRPGERFEAEDVGQMMIAVKMSRHRNKAKRDNLTDTAGYAETLSMIAEWRAANPGVDPRDRF